MPFSIFVTKFLGASVSFPFFVTDDRLLPSLLSLLSSTRCAAGYGLVLSLSVLSSSFQRAAERNLSLVDTMNRNAADLADLAAADGLAEYAAANASSANQSAGQGWLDKAEEAEEKGKAEKLMAADDQAKGESAMARAKNEDEEVLAHLEEAVRDEATYEANLSNATAEADKAAEDKELADNTDSGICQWAIFRSILCRNSQEAEDAKTEAEERAKEEGAKALKSLNDAKVAMDNEKNETKVAAALKDQSKADKEKAEEFVAKAQKEKADAPEDAEEAKDDRAKADALLLKSEEEAVRSNELKVNVTNAIRGAAELQRESTGRSRHAWWDAAVASALSIGVIGALSARLAVCYVAPVVLRFLAWALSLHRRVRLAPSRVKAAILIGHSLPKEVPSFCLLHCAVFLFAIGSFVEAWPESTEELPTQCRGSKILAPFFIWTVLKFAYISAAAQCLCLLGGRWLHLALLSSTQSKNQGGTVERGYTTRKMNICNGMTVVQLACGFYMFFLFSLLFALEVTILWVIFGHSLFECSLVSQHRPVLTGALVVVFTVLYLYCHGINPDGWEFWLGPKCGDGIIEDYNTDKIFYGIDRDVNDLNLEADGILRVFDEIDVDSRGAGSSRDSHHSFLESDSLLRSGGRDTKSNVERQPSESSSEDDAFYSVALGMVGAMQSTLGSQSSPFSPLAVEVTVVPHIRFLEVPFSVLVVTCMVSIVVWSMAKLPQLSLAFISQDGSSAEPWRVPLFIITVIVSLLISMLAVSDRNIRQMFSQSSYLSLAG